METTATARMSKMLAATAFLAAVMMISQSERSPIFVAVEAVEPTTGTGGDSIIWSETFDSPVEPCGDVFITSNGQFTDGFGDFFTKTDGSNIGQFVSYEGFENNFFAAMDIDGEGDPSEQSISWYNIDLSATSSSSITFCGLFAEDDNGANQDWDTDDFVKVQYQIDDNGFQDLLCFESIPDGDAFNAVPAVDTDCNGDGDGPELTNEAQLLCSTITDVENASKISIKIIVSLNAGDEDIAFDSLVLCEGEHSCPAPTVDSPKLDCPSQDDPPQDDGPVITPIHDVQGSGSISPLDGQTVTVEAVVTTLVVGRGTVRGFFLQEEEIDQDGLDSTSEGLYVFCGSCAGSVAEGDLVQVTGQVTEFFNQTQLGGAVVITVVSNDNLGLPPEPTNLFLPATGGTNEEETFEPIEGMVVTFPIDLTVAEYFELARFGQIVLYANGRPSQFTEINEPTTIGFEAYTRELATRRIILDDTSTDQNPDFIYWPGQPGFSSPDNFFRGGDTVTGLTGVLEWSFGNWRVRPTQAHKVAFAPSNPRPGPPTVYTEGNLKVASFNVLNYFTTIDIDGNTCGPSSIGCRGADSTAELERQTTKIIAALVKIDADIVGLIEIENDVDDASVMKLVNELNNAVSASNGKPMYDYIKTGYIGTDAIKVAMIYKPSRVKPWKSPLILDSSADDRFIDTKNRPVLIQTFTVREDGGKLTIAVNHFKSKGSSCDDVGDPDKGDGSGRCDGVRTNASLSLLDFIDNNVKFNRNVLVIGDLNSYSREVPITSFIERGYTDVLETLNPGSYTYLFDGQIGKLDFALASSGLLNKVVGAESWNINADEVNLFDYNDDVRDQSERSFEAKPIDPFVPDEYRSSDHDAVIVTLKMVEEDEDNEDCADNSEENDRRRLRPRRCVDN